MKALAAILLESIIEALYPAATGEGEKRKLKASAGGLALILVLVGGGMLYLDSRANRAELTAFRTEFREFKGLVWNALVQQGRVAKAEPAKESPTAAPFRGFIPSAEADDGVVGAGVPAGIPAVPDSAGVDRVGKLNEVR